MRTRTNDTDATLNEQTRSLRKMKVLATTLPALDEDATMKEKINLWLQTAGVTLITQNKDRLASLVSETVRKWDPRETSRRIELNVGKDPQWIRINGTVIGGLVGLIIYAVSLLFRNMG